MGDKKEGNGWKKEKKILFCAFSSPHASPQDVSLSFLPPFHMGMEINVKKWKGEGEGFFLALRNNSESPKQIRK